MKKMKISVEGFSESATKVISKSGKFKVVMDEPAQMGGTDEGPTPMQLLLMSLVGCLNITGQAVAQQKGMTLKNLNIVIEGEMNPAAFMGLSFEQRAGFSHIQVNIDANFVGASQNDINQWLEETENRCPVTDTIKAHTKIHLKHNSPIHLS